MGLGAILSSHQNRRCRKSAANSNIMGANVDKQRRFRAEHHANLFRAESASSDVSWRFCVSLMTARCCKSAPICVPAGANPGRERTPRQIANLTTTAGPLSGSPRGGWRAALFPRISVDYGETHGRPLAPIMGGWRAACFPRKCADYDDKHGCPPAPHGGWRAAFCPDMRPLWRRTKTHGRPLAPIMGAGGRLFVPDMRPLWRRPWRSASRRSFDILDYSA